MFNPLRRSYYDFWAEIDDPLHRTDSDEHMDAYGSELQLLFQGSIAGRSVLDLGCGNGALYRPLGFHTAGKFVGVDFSPAMVRAFRSNHPSTEVVEHDASTFRIDGTFDLIFSNSVVQNFDLDMFRQHLRNARAMLAPSGAIVVASIPWRQLRPAYYGGMTGAAPAHRNPILRAPATAVRMLRRSHVMGRWYTMVEVADVASEFGLVSTFYGSIHYPYRFHARLVPSGRLTSP